jgi:hypothetical protein
VPSPRGSGGIETLTFPCARKFLDHPDAEILGCAVTGGLSIGFADEHRISCTSANYLIPRLQNGKGQARIRYAQRKVTSISLKARKICC